MANSKGSPLLVRSIRWLICFFFFVFFGSLVETIREVRPELVEGHQGSTPISKSIPPRFFHDATPHIEGIGEPTTACFFSKSSIDPTNWFVLLPSPSPRDALLSTQL